MEPEKIQSVSRKNAWVAGPHAPEIGESALRRAILQVHRPLYVVAMDGQTGVAQDGTAIIGEPASKVQKDLPLLAYAPPLAPTDLGDPSFKQSMGIELPYVAGAMANGITSVEMVAAVGHAGMIGFFGAAGLALPEIRDAIDELQRITPAIPFGFNLIHSPSEPDHEDAVVDLYLEKGIRCVSASAYLRLTAPLVRYRVKGIHRDANGDIRCANRIVAKVSRVEVAGRFLSPAPEKILRQLVETGRITALEAELASQVPMTDHLTAEADSGGHTDNRPAISLLPTMTALRDALTVQHGYRRPISVGLAGGIATPGAAAAAFAMGAGYILTGSINQACVESGTSETVRAMLAEAGQADVTMAPAADMFEMGVRVQVLKRGTMFPIRATKLYSFYNNYGSFDDIPEKDRRMIEQDLFRMSFGEIWEETKRFFLSRDPRQVEKGERNPKHRMALVFRWYLGRSSRWANTGDPSRKMDYQIWCGPAMGAFNEWSSGSFMQNASNRRVVNVAMNLLLGACVMTRVYWLETQGVFLPPIVRRFIPMEDHEIQAVTGAGGH